MDIGFLVHLTDGGLRYFAATRGLGNVFYTAYGNASEIPLNEGFLYAALPVAVPLNNSHFKRNAIEPGHMERDVSGGGGKVLAIVVAAVALAGLVALVAGSLGPASQPHAPAAHLAFLPRCLGPMILKGLFG